MQGIGIVFGGIRPGVFPSLGQKWRIEDMRPIRTKPFQVPIQVRSFCQLRWRQGLGQCLSVYADGTGAERCGYFVCGEGTVINPGFLDLASQRGDAGRQMAFAQHHPRLARRERLQGASLVAFAVGQSVAVQRDGMVGSIDRHEMHQLAGLGGLGRTSEILGAAEKIAAGDPTGGLPFAKDDGVEVLAVRRLDRQRSPALLVQTGERHPNFEGFFAQIGG